MPHVLFSADFDFDPDALGGRVSIAYKAGQRKTVTRECAAKAKAAGKAEEVERLKVKNDER